MRKTWNRRYRYSCAWLTAYFFCLVDVLFNSRHSYGYQLFSASCLICLFLYSYEEDFIQGDFGKNEKKSAGSFNFMFRSIDDEHSLNMYCVYVYPIFPIKLYLKDTTYTSKFASYPYIYLEIDRDARLRTKNFDKRDDFNFVIAKFPYLMLQHSNRTCIWSIYLSVGMIFMNSLIEDCCLLGCYWTVTEYLSHR